MNALAPRELIWVRGRVAGFGLKLIEAEGGGWALAEGYGVGRWPDASGESWENILRFVKRSNRNHPEE